MRVLGILRSATNITKAGVRGKLIVTLLTAIHNFAHNYPVTNSLVSLCIDAMLEVLETRFTVYLHDDLGQPLLILRIASML